MRFGLGLIRHGAGPGWGPLAGATLYPDAPAITDDRGTVTFGELEAQCEAAADGLAARVSPGDVVAIIGRNSSLFYLTMVAATRCGADVLYLNTGFSPEQIADAVARNGVRAIVHDAEFARRVPQHVLSIPMTGDQDATIERMATQPRSQPSPPARRSRHIMLTSGTTGQPKGTSRTGGEVSSAVALLSGLPYRTRQTCLIAAPMFHAWGWLNTMLSMLFSSSLVVTRRFDPEETLALIERERCQVLVAVPTMLRRIMGLPPEIRRGYDTSSLRAVTVSGSALPPLLATEFMNEFGDILYSLYGSTEAGYAAVATPADLRAAPGTAGRPLPTVDVQVLDNQGTRCPPGSTGMIWVSSRDSLAEPGSPDGRGPVSTGDIGSFDAAGRLFVAGRADDMIITGGENVYPSEVENALEQHPDVAEAAVTGSPDEVYGQVLVAHVVLRDGGGAIDDVTSDALRSWCRERLAPFQVPHRFVVHDALPHNPAGKVVKRALTEPGRD